MTNSLDREQLDQMSCNHPGCSHEGHPLVLHSRCHPRAAQIVRFDLDSKAIECSCSDCSRFIALIALHPGEVARLADGLRERQIALARSQGMKPGMRLRPPCHRREDLHVVYEAGYVHAACAVCQEVADTFCVLERHSEWASS